MAIDIINETNFLIDNRCFHDLIIFCFDSLKIDLESDMGLRFVSEKEIADLHMEWLNEPGATDVMSFPMDEMKPGTDKKLSLGVLGDIVICPSFSSKQAEKVGNLLNVEMEILLCHGILHLLGFDHVELADEMRMFSLQREIHQNFYFQHKKSIENITYPRAKLEMA